jgi:hypothetical protein
MLFFGVERLRLRRADRRYGLHCGAGAEQAAGLPRQVRVLLCRMLADSHARKGIESVVP